MVADFNTNIWTSKHNKYCLRSIWESWHTENVLQRTKQSICLQYNSISSFFWESSWSHEVPCFFPKNSPQLFSLQCNFVSESRLRLLISWAFRPTTKLWVSCGAEKPGLSAVFAINPACSLSFANCYCLMVGCLVKKCTIAAQTMDFLANDQKDHFSVIEGFLMSNSLGSYFLYAFSQLRSTNGFPSNLMSMFTVQVRCSWQA